MLDKPDRLICFSRLGSECKPLRDSVIGLTATGTKSSSRKKAHRFLSLMAHSHRVLLSSPSNPESKTARLELVLGTSEGR